MNRDFVNNVTKLFHEIVTDCKETASAAELNAFLQRKKILPLKSYEADNRLKLTYYNVSLDVASDLSSMQIIYTSDIAVTLNDLQHYDVFQLSEFVMALERDIPRWTHIWATERQLARERVTINERIKSTLKEIRNGWVEGLATAAKIKEYRIMYYNIKATELMLQNSNPFWTNKKSEAEILEECQVFHVDAPIEQWLDSWNNFVDECNKKKAQHERLLEEQHIKLMKQIHLAKLKQLKLEANVKTIMLHPFVTLKVWTSFGVCGEFDVRRGSYYITLGIDKAHVVFDINYYALDMSLKMVVESLKRINDLAFELKNTLAADGEQYFVGANPIRRNCEGGPFFIAQHSNLCDEEASNKYLVSGLMTANRHMDMVECEHLLSVGVINQINQICHQLKNYIASCEPQS